MGNGRDTTSEEALFVREDGVETDGGDAVGLLPASPKRRATSQDAVVIEDDAVDDPIIPPIVISTPPSEDVLPPSMPPGGGKRLSLTPGEQAEVLAEANQEGMPPSTVPLPNPTPLVASGGLSAGPLSPRRRGSGSSRPFEEHSAVWTGDEDDEEEEDGGPESRSTEGFEVGGELNVNPSPPWADSGRDPVAAFPPNTSDMGLHTPAHVPPAPPDQAPAPPDQELSGANAVPAGSGTCRVEGMGGGGDESASTLITFGGKGGLGALVGTEADCSGVESLPDNVAAVVEGGEEGASECVVDSRESGLGKGATNELPAETGSPRDTSTQESERSVNEQTVSLSGELRLVVGDELGSSDAGTDSNSATVPVPDGVVAGETELSESNGRVTLKEEAGPIDKSRSVVVAVAEDGRKEEGGRE